jgi:hypothetical protein
VLPALAALPALVLAACGGSEPPRSAPAVPGASGTPGEARPPEAPTPVPPTPTTPPPTPTPDPRSPFTGRLVGDGSLLHRRIVAVKIDNAPQARPQLGLAYADLVYEQLAEGNLTRFLAFFLEGEPERVGPVRSARLTDIYLGQEWEFVLAYAGAGRTTSRFLGDGLFPLLKAPELGERLDGTPYSRDGRRPVPHNLFVKVSDAREAARREPGNAEEVEIRPFPFREGPLDSGPLRALNLPYVPVAAVTWRYDPESGLWRRSMGGAPHVDGLNGQQIAVENVLIQYAQIFTAQGVEPDAAGNPVLDTVLRGENTVRLFHSGQMFEGVWSKEHDRAKTEYRLPDGSPLPFKPGKVWVHIVPTDFAATWS